MTSKKEHLTLEGLQSIRSIMSKMNNNRKFEDKYNYCKHSLDLFFNNSGDTETNYNLPSEWVQGFIEGEGTFYTYIGDRLNKQITHCDSSLEIAQNNHDVVVLIAIKSFFLRGYIKPKYNYNNIGECINSRSVNRYILRDTTSIISFLDKYPLLSRKNLDYRDWFFFLKIVELKKEGAHKTIVG